MIAYCDFVLLCASDISYNLSHVCYFYISVMVFGLLFKICLVRAFYDSLMGMNYCLIKSVSGWNNWTINRSKQKQWNWLLFQSAALELFSSCPIRGIHEMSGQIFTVVPIFQRINKSEKKNLRIQGQDTSDPLPLITQQLTNKASPPCRFYWNFQWFGLQIKLHFDLIR